MFYPGYKCKGVNVLVQQTVTPYEFAVHRISDNWLTVGSFEVSQAIEQINNMEEGDSYDL
jgi:hypothetical protein